MAGKPAKTKQPVAKKKANGYKMPGHIPKGETLTDVQKNTWIIDVSIGTGGFGEIYSSCLSTDTSKKNFVVKIEPFENGPLFCERAAYVRIGKKEDIAEFTALRKLKTFGMPQFHGFGSHEVGGTKYRFLVMERYGTDLWSLFTENKKRFPVQTVLKIGIQVLDVLEYIHLKSYIHADIKGGNLLLGRTKATENQVYLVDFGLATKYATELKPDPRSAHNGTLEYTSRDAHTGLSTRRGDIEILGYNLLHWSASSLPWETLKDPPSVQKRKNSHLENIPGLLKSCFKDTPAPDALHNYLKFLCTIEPLDEPDYKKIRQILENGLKPFGKVEKLIFSVGAASPEKQRNKTDRGGKEEVVKDRPRLRTRSKEIQKRSKSAPRRSMSAENSTGNAKKKVAKKEASNKRSWKDFPTIVNGAKANDESEADRPARKRGKK